MAPLLPIMGVVFMAFLIIGMAMPVLSLHVNQGLGLGTFVIVSGAAAVALRLLRPALPAAGEVQRMTS